MKLREKMKRFWTLDVHNHEGFTLVELIIVIAILAILSTGAIAGYSAYIKQANMTTDKALFAEIENVLMLAGYSGTFVEGDGGYIHLSVNGVENAAEIEEDSALDKAMDDAFGSAWRETLKLKYSEWGFEGSVAGLVNAQAVKNSSYYQSADKLMAQVEEITGAAWNLVENQNGQANREQMVAMFEGSLLTGIASQYGYDSIDDVPDDALPNLLVLAVASDVATGTNNPDHTMSQASGLIQNFALYNGYASTQAGKDSGFSAAYETFVQQINEASSVDEVANAYRTLRAQTEGNEGWTTYKNSDQSQTDSEAFAAMMGGMAGSTLTHGEAIKNHLAQSNFFTEGLGNELFSNYISGVDAMAGMNSEQAGEIAEAVVSNPGSVVIYFSMAQGEINVKNTLPTE